MTKIKFNVDELLPKLTQVVKVVGTKNTIRVLDYVRFKTVANELTMMASDNETWLSVNAQVEVEDDDALFCVEATKLIASLQMLGGAVTLELDETRKIVKGDYGSGFFEMPYIDGDEFPVSVVVGDTKELVMRAGNLCTLLQQPLFAVGGDNLRPTITCLRLDFQNDKAVSCGTDSRILVRYTQNSEFSVGENGINIPQKPANVIVALLTTLDSDEEIQVAFTSTQFIVSSKSSFQLSTRLNTGNYPNYNAVIPQDNELVATIVKDILVGALKRVIPFGNSKICAVVFNFTPQSLNVSARDVDYSTSASEDVPCDFNGDCLKIGFNGNQIIEAIKNTPSQDGNIYIKLKAPERAAVVVPDVNAEGSEYISMVMPMMID